MTEYVVEFGNVGRPPEADGRLDAPAFHRNHKPIWAVLGKFLEGKTGDVFEVGSGTGQHAVAFAREAPGIVWWPSDCNDAHLQSIAAWRAYAGLANMRAPLRVDLMRPDWGERPGAETLPRELLAIVCINVLHIAPWAVAEGLLSSAARYLRPDGRLFVYGPFMRDGRHTAASNAAFDASLRRADPSWGVRDTRDLAALAERCRLVLAEIVEMPANNLVLVFQRAAAA
jgi:SAM-dependent methyltransferase